MALPTLFLVSLAASAFFAVNVGGSSTGVAFGPAVGSGAVHPGRAALLMTASVFAGGLTLGPRVTETLGAEFVPASAFTIEAAVVVLSVTGVGILLGNLLGVSVSTTGTAVGAVAGLGVAVDALHWATVGEVVGWWVLAAVLAFWLAGLAGRYAYAGIAAALVRRSTAPVRRRALVAAGCGIAFAAGGSNAANATGALVGANALTMTPAVVLACAGIGVGAVVFGPRTMATVGEGITDLPVEAALVVQAVAATVVTALNVASIPASLAVTTTMAVVGLGWGVPPASWTARGPAVRTPSARPAGPPAGSCTTST